ncbi:LapA family protein [Virgibacillus flavescens]|uniref:LapA family protein n=1 Tax=Virgibacillus flavescens TaxID=1611422 RepID=UPI003D347FD7
MKGQSYVIFAILFVIIVAIFAVINVDPVEVNYLFGTGEAPLIFVILFSVLMGGIITAAVGILKVFRLQREINALRKENVQLTKETPSVVNEEPHEMDNDKSILDHSNQDKQI